MTSEHARRTTHSAWALALASLFAGCGRLRFEVQPPAEDAAALDGGLADGAPSLEGREAGDNSAETSVLEDAGSESPPPGEDASGFADATLADGGRACMPGRAGANCELCVRYVDAASAAPIADGLSWESAHGDLFLALSAARLAASNAGTSCEVWVREGRYHVYRTLRLDTLSLSALTPLVGGFAGHETTLAQRDLAAHESVLDGENPTGTGRTSNVVTAAAGGSVDGFTITSNAVRANDNGRALQVTGGHVRVSNVRFVENDVSRPLNELGGAISVSAGASLTVERSQFVGNRARRGGAIAATNASVTLREVRFTDNTAAEEGGAVYLDASSLSLEGASFEQNRADGSGAAIGATAGAAATVSLTRATLRANAAGGNGGGLYFAGPFTLTLSNLLLAQNSAGGSGGGAYVTGVQGSLAASTLGFNTAGSGASGLALSCTGECRVFNTILWNPSPLSELARSGNTIFASSLVRGGTDGSAISNGDPQFLAAPADLHLGASSPAIDAAHGCAGPERDLDGAGRVDIPVIVNSGVGPVFSDLGAYEFTSGGAAYGRFAELCP